MSRDDEPTIEELAQELSESKGNPLLLNEQLNPSKRKAAVRDETVSESEHIRLSEEAEKREKSIIRSKKREDYKRGNYKGERTKCSWLITVEVIEDLKKISKIHLLNDAEHSTNDFVQKALEKSCSAELKRLEKSTDPALWALVNK